MKKSNTKYAVIRIKGNQYKVSEGEEFLVNKIGKKIESETLMIVDGEKVKIGKPVLQGSKIDLEVVEPLEKGEKLHVFTFKAKSKYRKRKGFRPIFSRLKVKSISI